MDQQTRQTFVTLTQTQTWARPEIVVQVAFVEWTVYGKLRHPRLLGIRNDKAAGEVVRDVP